MLPPGFENGLGWGVAYIPPIAEDAMDGAPERSCLAWEQGKATRFELCLVLAVAAFDGVEEFG